MYNTFHPPTVWSGNGTNKRRIGTVLVTARKVDAKAFAADIRKGDGPSPGRRVRTFTRTIKAGNAQFEVYVVVSDYPAKT